MQTASVQKCAHGVYITSEDLGSHFGPAVSQSCSVCQSEYPHLDWRYGETHENLAHPRTLTGVYELWKELPSDQSYEMLFHAVRKFAKGIAKKMFAGDPNVTDEWHDVAEDVATKVMLSLKTNGPTKAGFSTWAYSVIENQLIDWQRGLEINDLSLDDASHPVEAEDVHASPSEKVFVREVKDRLTPEERQLFELVASGYTQKEIGVKLGLAQRTVSHRWKDVCEKIRVIGQ